MIAPFADIAGALKIAARDAVIVAERDEHTAHDIGLFPQTAANIISERKRHAELIGDAYRVFRKLMPVENTIKSIMEEAA